jgi:hypothetical protein
MSTKNDPQNIEDLGSRSIKDISVLMRQAAEDFGLSVETENVFAEVRPGVTAAFVATIGETSTLGLLYVSFPTFACAQTLRTGFYKVDHITADGQSKVEYRDAKGHAVMTKPLLWTTTPRHAGTGLSFRAVNAVIIQWWKGTPQGGTAHGEIVIGEPK